MIRGLRPFCVACVAAGASLTSAIAQDVNVEMTVLADQIRSQGYPCSKPVSAERKPAESVQNEPVYVLKCEDATYEIRLIPDQAAMVTKIQ